MKRLAKKCFLAFSFPLVLSFAGMAQSPQIIGSETDQNRAPLSRVNMLVKGTKTGVTTGEAGSLKFKRDKTTVFYLVSFMQDVCAAKGQPVPPPYANPAFDWQDEVFRTAPQKAISCQQAEVPAREEATAN